VHGRIQRRRTPSEWTTRVVSVRRDVDRVQAKRHGRELARLAKLGAERAADLDVVIHELASNLLDHAGQGELWLRVVNGERVEVAAIDAGPGMIGADRVLARTSLTGLPNVKRLATLFELETRQGIGTHVRAVIARSDLPRHC